MVGTFRDIYGQRKEAGAYGAMPKAWTLESEGSELESIPTDAYRHFIIAFSSLFNLCNKNNNLRCLACSAVFFPKPYSHHGFSVALWGKRAHSHPIPAFHLQSALPLGKDSWQQI